MEKSSEASSMDIHEVLQENHFETMEKFPINHQLFNPEDFSKGKNEEFNFSNLPCKGMSASCTYRSNYPFAELLADADQMNKEELKLEFGNIFGIITKPRLKIREREKHADDEEDNLVELLRQMRSLSVKKMYSFVYPSLMIKIDGENMAVDEDLEMTQNGFTIHKKHPKHDFTIWATFFTGQLGIACCLGNPFDKLLWKLESSGKVKDQSLLNFEEAVSVFLPSIIWGAMFFLNFIYTTILARPLPFRALANSILAFLLLYYILALAEATCGSSVLWASVQISALLFVSGGAIGLMLLSGFIIMGVKIFFTRRFLSKLG